LTIEKHKPLDAVRAAHNTVYRHFTFPASRHQRNLFPDSVPRLERLELIAHISTVVTSYATSRKLTGSSRKFARVADTKYQP